MSLHTLIPWLMGAIAISVAAMVSGVWSGQPMLVSAASLLFALVMVATCWQINRPLLALTPDRIADDALPIAVRRNARLLALTYLWGGFAMVALYRGTSLRWQHGMQYAVGMALIGLVIILWVRFSSRPGSWLSGPVCMRIALRGAILHAFAALGGLGFLIGSGKILSTRPDWAANQVFLAGGLTVLGLSLISIPAHLHLTRAERTPPSSP